jgi:hypothetical protein
MPYHGHMSGRLSMIGIKKLLKNTPSGIIGCLCLLWVGCGGDGENAIMKAAIESDANGYISAKGHKFYTGSGVFAEKCPASGTMDLEPVVAYVADDWTKGSTNYVIAPQRLGAVKAPWDGQILRKIVMPSEKQLEAWGAVKADEASVKLAQ